MPTDERIDTRCVHAGELHDPQGSPHTPIYTSTTFAFANTAALLDVVEGRREGNLYARYGLNPTIRSLEAKLETLEGAEAALAFSAGMTAWTNADLTMVRGVTSREAERRGGTVYSGSN